MKYGEIVPRVIEHPNPEKDSGPQYRGMGNMSHYLPWFSPYELTKVASGNGYKSPTEPLISP
jgi:hypothetical protein